MFSSQCIKWQCLNKIKCCRSCSKSSSSQQNIFKRFLLLTNCLSCGGCMAMGDLVEQEFEFRSKIIPVRYDWTRASHMFTVGTLMGPLYHYYYTALDRWKPEVTLKSVIIKIVLDQTVMSPINLLSFYCGMDYLDGKSFQVCTNELKKKFWKTFSIDCLYWPPVQFINFYFLPNTYRVLYVNVATLVYNIFLSYMKHYDEHK